MRLNLKELKNFDTSLKVRLPKFNVEKVKQNTILSPTWLHFGAGNLFRAYIGKIQQELLDKGVEKTGIIVAENFDSEIIEKVYKPFDNLTISTALDKNGKFENQIIGSIVESLAINEETMKELKSIVEKDSLQIMSFTITEKGYSIKNANGEYFDIVIKDIENNLENPNHIISLITKLLYFRYKSDKKPITLLSMDNCSGNGDKLKSAVVEVALELSRRGVYEKEFIDYLTDEKTLGFPITMIDKITPRPAIEVKESLEKLGFENMDIVVTSKNSYVAPFVNAEIPEYFVIEDRFTNGRPKFEEAGVYIATREIVEKTERMKVTTCLNPLHTTLAIYGCLFNKRSIYEAMNDNELGELVRRVGYNEGLVVVENPEIIDPKKFIDEVINERFLNPYIPDQPERIATDTSQKMGIRFGETIKSYRKSRELDVKTLKYIPLVIAGWFRYLLGIDDFGNERSISNDPMLAELKRELKGIEYGKTESYIGQLKPILRNESIFGINLEEIGMSDLIESYFIEMLCGKDAVRNTLKKYLK